MREFWRTMTGPKQGVYSGTICSSKRFDHSWLTIGFKCIVRSRQIVSTRWIALRERIRTSPSLGAY